MNGNGGYIKLSRDALDDEFFEEKRPLTKLEAFMWLIKKAQYKKEPKKVWFNNKEWTVNRGELVTSTRILQKTWRWGSNNTVKRFLLKLQERHSLGTAFVAEGVQINVCKSVFYEDEWHSDGTALKKKLHTNSNKGNKRIKEYSSSNSASAEDFKIQLLSDQLFLETTAISKKIRIEEIPELLEEFMLQKIAFDELTHKDYNAYKKNFWFWIDKKKMNQPKSPKNKNRKKSTGRKQILKGEDFTKNLEESARKMGVKIHKS